MDDEVRQSVREQIKRGRSNSRVRYTSWVISVACLVCFSPLACAQKKGSTSVPIASAKTTDAGAKTKAADMGAPQEQNEPIADWLKDINTGKHFDASVHRMLQKNKWNDAFNALKSKDLHAKGEHLGLLARIYAGMKSGNEVTCLSDAKKALKMSVLSEFSSDVASWGVQCAYTLEKWNDVTQLAARVEPTHPDHKKSLYLLGEALIKAGGSSDLEQAEKVFAAYLKLYPESANAELVRFSYARLLEQNKKYGEAAELYNEVITHYPLSSNVSEAIKSLSTLKPKSSKVVRQRIEETSDQQRINKLRALFKRHRSDEVLSNGDRYLKHFKKGGELYCETQYLMGKSLTKLRNHSDSIQHYENVVKHCGSSQWVVKSYYLMGRGYWNAGDRSKAKRAFKQLWKAYPSHSYADDAMLYAAKIAKSENDTKEMRKLLRLQVKTYPKGDMLSDAQWLLMQNLYLDKDYQEAIDFAREAAKLDAKQTLYTRGRLEYFAGRASEQLKKKEQAKEFYIKVSNENPLGYYALLSMNRLAVMSGNTLEVDNLCKLEKIKLCNGLQEYSKEAVLAKGGVSGEVEVSEKIKSEETFKRGRIFLRLGLEQLAQTEFHQLSATYSSDHDALWSLAMLLDAAGAYPFSHDIPRRKIEGWEVGYPISITQNYWEIAYPRPFEDEVTSWADKRGIPREVVWAIMREESGFNPRIESWANARGLLQLMEGTAKTVAKQDDFKDFERSDLFDVDSNIRLGTAYIKELSDNFDAHPALMIAGYNGGAGNVNNWLEKRGGMDLDMWVEEIPYGQTRNYTKRVLTSFWTYHWLYGEGATPRLPFALPKPS